MRLYAAFYKNRKYLVEATSSYEAQCLAARFFNVKPKQRYMIAVVLTDVPINTAAI